MVPGRGPVQAHQKKLNKSIREAKRRLSGLQKHHHHYCWRVILMVGQNSAVRINWSWTAFPKMQCLLWTSHINTVNKKALQRMYCLRVLWKFNLLPGTHFNSSVCPVHFHHVLFNSATKLDKSCKGQLELQRKSSGPIFPLSRTNSPAPGGGPVTSLQTLDTNCKASIQQHPFH